MWDRSYVVFKWNLEWMNPSDEGGDWVEFDEKRNKNRVVKGEIVTAKYNSSHARP